jgi:hypothetical protein
MKVGRLLPRRLSFPDSPQADAAVKEALESLSVRAPAPSPPSPAEIEAAALASQKDAVNPFLWVHARKDANP